MGSGYSVKAQITGQDNIGGLQFEITPKHLDSYNSGNALSPEIPVSSITVQMPNGKKFALKVAPCYTIGNVKKLIEEHEGISAENQALTFDNIAPGDDDGEFPLAQLIFF